jgi:RND superfamily putative drug exporter
MICVFASFALGDNRDIKLFGISMASAVLLDAFVVRSLLLPSVRTCSVRARGGCPSGCAVVPPRSLWRAGDPSSRTVRSGSGGVLLRR